jgi:hypothetical protein
LHVASQKDEEGAMEKMAGLQKRSQKVFLSVIAAVSILWTGSSVQAVGPYFENERSPNGQNQGPNPTWPRPQAPMWSPPNPQILTIESLKKGQIFLKNSKESSTAATKAPDVVDKTHKQVAQR